MSDLPPMLGFWQETYVPGAPSNGKNGSGWVAFYTCICNGKRVYAWAWNHNRKDENCCVMVRDSYDPLHNAHISELHNAFVSQHRRNINEGKRATYRVERDPLLLQAFINEITRGGNEHVKPEAYSQHGRT